MHATYAAPLHSGMIGRAGGPVYRSLSFKLGLILVALVSMGNFVLSKGILRAVDQQLWEFLQKRELITVEVLVLYRSEKKRGRRTFENLIVPVDFFDKKNEFYLLFFLRQLSV